MPHRARRTSGTNGGGPTFPVGLRCVFARRGDFRWECADGCGRFHYDHRQPRATPAEGCAVRLIAGGGDVAVRDLMRALLRDLHRASVTAVPDACRPLRPLVRGLVAQRPQLLAPEDFFVMADTVARLAPGAADRSVLLEALACLPKAATRNGWAVTPATAEAFLGANAPEVREIGLALLPCIPPARRARGRRSP